MLNRQKLIEYCLSLPGTYEDYPFQDTNWTVMRHTGTKKSFAFLYRRNGFDCANLKCDPMRSDFLKRMYPSVTPGYHMNKTHWITVILDGTVCEEEVLGMIDHSYFITQTKKRNSSADLQE